MMGSLSDEDIEVETDEGEEDSDSRQPSGRQQAGTIYFSQENKRAHHNALERRRRDELKISFTSLKETVPDLHREKASRAQILKKTADYIISMRDKNHSHETDIEDLERQNQALEKQIRQLKRAKRAANLDLDNSDSQTSNFGSESDLSDEAPVTPKRRYKKTKHH